MEIKFNPRVSGAFVEFLLSTDEVDEVLNLINDKEEDKHAVVKAIAIAALKYFRIDINELINFKSRQVLPPQEQEVPSRDR